LRSKSVQGSERSGDRRDVVLESKSFRPDFECGDGTERLSTWGAPERFFWSGKALFGNEGRCLRVQHHGVDWIDVRAPRVAALDLSDLEIDRAKRNAKADEFVMLSALEREVQGKMEQAPPYEKVLAHFLTKRGVKRALVPANFPLGYANEIKRCGISLETTNGLFWPAREKKTAEEIKLLEGALRMTETGMKRGMEILKASTPGTGKKLKWSGKTLTSEILRAEIDSAILRAGGVPTTTIVAGGDQACDPHERGIGPPRADSLII